MMLRDVVEVVPLACYKLHVTFDDGAAGETHIARLIPFEGIFAPLRDPVYFWQFHIHPELGTLTWPNGADPDSDVLYHEVTGAPLPAAEFA